VALELENRPASSFIPEMKSWLKNTVNSDFYFCEVQSEEASSYGIKGLWAEEGEILLNACNTNWRKWNKQAEELKTAAVLRSENEYKGASPVFVRYPSGNSVFYISTIAYFAHTEKGYNTLDKILQQAGIPAEGKKLSEKLMDEKGAINTGNLFEKSSGNFKEYGFWLWSPRPLDDLLIEPDMPKLDMELISGNDSELLLNGTKLNALKTLPLKQGWNQIVIKIPGKEKISSIRFICENNPAFISQLKTDFQNPVKK
ncbi:MAG: glycoside hydrolase family 2, partial [Candidatus Symbiothrix sp.]|nr:glycoside hydrolase family 2 [Candidatus Symbiothrix sp.]